MAWDSILAALGGNLGEHERFMAREKRTGAEAMTAVVKATGEAALKAGRGRIAPVLGRRMANTLRGKLYPERGVSLSAAYVIRSSAIYLRYGEKVDLLTVHAEGATIRSRRGTFIALPIRVPRRGGRFPTPQEYGFASLTFIPIRHGIAALVDAEAEEAAERGRGDFPPILYLLVKEATVPPRLGDLVGFLASFGESIDTDHVVEWERLMRQAA